MPKNSSGAAARVASALPDGIPARAGKSLNRAVAERIMGWLYWDGKGDWRPPKGRRRATMFATWDRVSLSVYERGSDDVTLRFSFSPSTDMSDAWEVVRRLQARGHELRLYARPHNVPDSPGATGAIFYRHAAELLMEAEWDKRFVIADSAPLAICRAALRAVGNAGEVPADSATTPTVNSGEAEE